MKRLTKSPFVSGLLAFLFFFSTLPLDALAGEFTVFGPKRYVRDSSAPDTVTDTFQVLN